jgi:hypothetical protein
MVKEKVILIKFKALYPDTKKPTKKVGDAGWDCYVHHFVQYFPKELNESKKEELKDYMDNNYWNLPSLISPNLKYHNESDPCLNPFIIGCALGFSTSISKEYFAQLCPRSGLALKKGVETIIGTIDSTYRGEWIAIIKNTSNMDFTIHIGDKICQFVVRKYIETDLIDTNDLDATERGENGFGHSGTK